MFIRKCRPTGRCSAVLLAALAFGGAQPASAQKVSEGGSFRPLPHRSSSYANPTIAPKRGESRRSGGESSRGHGTAFCVRTCDGRYFPLQRHAGMNPAEVCRALCPAAKTMVFSGSRIDGAVAPNGARYADLDQAFTYRNKRVPNCTCNGGEGLGLARIGAAADPTLRPGDIVATGEGLAVFNGKRDAAALTPVNPSSGEWARKLSEIKVRPAPPPEPVETTGSTAAEDEKPKLRLRRASATEPAARSPRRRATATLSAPATRSRTDASAPAARAGAAPRPRNQRRPHPAR